MIAVSHTNFIIFAISIHQLTEMSEVLVVFLIHITHSLTMYYLKSY